MKQNPENKSIINTNTILFFLLGTLFGFFIGFCFFGNIINKQNKVRVFIGKVINSAINDEEFHKENSKSRAGDNIEKHKKEFSKSYRVHIYDQTFYSYECIVTFNTGSSFYVDVVSYKKKFIVNIWDIDEWRK